MELHNLIICSNIVEIEKHLIKNPEAINKVYTDAPNYYTNQTPLLCAVEFSDIKTVKLLVDYGANINMYVRNRYFALGRSIHNRYACLGVIKLLLDYGADPNLEDSFNMKGLSHATYLNFREAVLILLEYDAHYDCNNIKTIILVEKIKLLNIKN